MSLKQNDQAMQDYYDDILGDDIIEPEQVGTVRFIGVDKVIIQRSTEMDSRWDGTDNSPEDPEQAAWDDIND